MPGSTGSRPRPAPFALPSPPCVSGCGGTSSRARRDYRHSSTPPHLPRLPAGAHPVRRPHLPERRRNPPPPGPALRDEFYHLETSSSRTRSLAKASLYQLYFNLPRPNSHKRGLTPRQIVWRLAPRLPLNLCLLAPTFLGCRLNAVPTGHPTTSKVGYDLPSLPKQFGKAMVQIFLPVTR